MTKTSRARGTALLGTTALLAVTCGAFVSVATPASAATGAYTGNAASDLVHVNAVNIPAAVDVADATVAPATSTVSTAASPRVRAHAYNANANLLSGAIDQNLVVEALQTAPPDHATGVHDELLSVPAAPALTATVTSADAHARWINDATCVTSGNISSSESRVAQAAVLPAAPGIGTAVTLDNSNDPDGAATAVTSVGLVKQPASAANYAVRTTSSTQVTSVSLLGGAIVADVITAPKVVATATGVAGTATVALTQPVLEINGQTLISGDTLSPINIPGAPVITLTVGTLTKSISADGRSASGLGNLLSLKVLDITGQITLLDLTVGDVNAASTAPAGGVSCGGLTPDPLRDARKDASAATVNPGKSFDYTITVPNRGNANLTNVKVVDTVSGSPALDLVKAVPAPISTSGSTYTFNLGTIVPNQVKTIVMTFKVPAGVDIGTKYSNKAVITATYGGQTVTKTVTTPYPTVDAPGVGPCDLSQSTKFASHLKVKTGENFTYYINAFNQGAQACTGIVVKDALPSGTSFVSCTHGCTHVGQLVTWNIATLSGGASTQLAVTVKTTATSGRLPNSADITPDSGTGGTPHTGGPTVTNVSILSPSFPAMRGDTDLPRTGGAPLAALAGIVLVGTGLVLRRRAIS